MDRKWRKKTAKYFCNLEKQNQTSNFIKELKTPNEDLINTCTTNSIIGEMIIYYKDLFKTANIPTDNISTYLDNIEVPMLNEKDKLMLDEFPTFEECKNPVLEMKGEKFPGLDGIPIEFFRSFWNIIGPIFYAALKEVFKQKEMSEIHKLSVISLIHKKGEKQLFKNIDQLAQQIRIIKL